MTSTRRPCFQLSCSYGVTSPAKQQLLSPRQHARYLCRLNTPCTSIFLFCTPMCPPSCSSLPYPYTPSSSADTPPMSRSTAAACSEIAAHVSCHAASFNQLLEPAYVRVFSIAVPSPWLLRSSCRITSSASLRGHIRPCPVPDRTLWPPINSAALPASQAN